MLTPRSRSPSPAPAYSTSRILHIYNDSKLSDRHATITDADKSHPLYTLDQNSAGLFSKKPHMRISSSQASTIIGAVTFHSMSRRVDLEIHGHEVAFEPAGTLTTSYEYASLAFGDSLKWKRDGWGSNLVLVNSKKEWIARFDAASFALKKVGKLEIGNGGIAGVALDEIVVTGLAMVELENRKRTHSSAGAAAAGASAGAGGGCSC
ncbi:MAG: hypothetical protein Q9218_005925 [Villophora microphyllina]